MRPFTLTAIPCPSLPDPCLSFTILKREVCAVGWEPNPLHTAYLRELERSYRRCGYRVTIFTGTGVGVRGDNLTFASVDTVRQIRG